MLQVVPELVGTSTNDVLITALNIVQTLFLAWLAARSSPRGGP
jgi:hypothetical protein